jgi:alpha-mannosidase
MSTLHLVTHTHWDREWYQTFQQFRLKLVRLMDHLLALLAPIPILIFMLDGRLSYSTTPAKSGLDGEIRYSSAADFDRPVCPAG